MFKSSRVRFCLFLFYYPLGSFSHQRWLNNNNLLYCGFWPPSGLQSENQRKRKERQVLRPCQRSKKVVEHGDNSDNNCNWNGPRRFGKGPEALEIGDRIETIQNIALLRLVRIARRVLKNRGDLLSLQPPIKDRQCE